MKIIYIKPSNSTFIRVDEGILQRNFNARSLLLRSDSTIKYILSVLRVAFLLFTHFKQYDAIFVRFADYHTALFVFIAKLLSKKFILVVGGFDVAFIPELNYGIFTSKIRGWCAKFTFKHATLIAPNCNSLVKYSNTFGLVTKADGGILNFTPSIEDKIKVVYNGFDKDFWNFDSSIPKEDICINVAIVNELKTFLVKGLDLFLKVAEKLPEINFIQVGLNSDFIRRNSINIPENVTIIQKTNTDQLKKLYANAKMYCILSRSEGMPNALCEAMLCGCIPIGSNVSSIPEIINGVGRIVITDNINEIASNVRQANKNQDYAIARDKIVNNFSLMKREEELKKLIQSL